MPNVSTGIIDFAFHPPLGELQPTIDGAGPYSGNVTLDTWSSTLGPTYTPHDINHTYGVIVQIDGAIPANWGMVRGYDDGVVVSADWYYHRFAQVVVQHQLRQAGDVITPTGPWVATQIVEVHMFPQLILWEVALPGRIGLLVAPGVSVDLYFLNVFGVY